MKPPSGLLALTATIGIVPAGLTIGLVLLAASPADAPAQEKVASKNEAPRFDRGRDIGPTRTPIRLIDAEGRPVVGAVASDFFRRDADYDSSFTTTEPAEEPRSDARGELALEFEIPNLIEAAAVYAIRQDGDRPLVGVRRVTVEEIEAGRPIAVVMYPACRVRLRVECPGFRELAEKYHVDLDGPDWWRAAYVRLGENGRAPRPLFTNSSRGELEFLLPPGRFTIVAYGGDVTAVNRTIDVRPGHRVLGLGVLEVSPSDEMKRGDFRGFWRSIRRDPLADRDDRQAGEGRIIYRRPRGGVSLKGDSVHATDIAYSPDGKLLATSHSRHVDPGEVKLWDSVTGAKLATLTARGRGVLALAFSPDGRLLAGHVGPAADPGSWPRVIVWDVASRREVRTLLGGPTCGIQAMAFSPDGKVLATIGGDRSVRSLDPWTGREAGRVDGIASGRELAVSPDGRTLAMSDAEGAFTLWDIPGKRLRATLEPEGDYFRLRSVAFAPDGRRLVAAGGVRGAPGDGQQSRVRLYDLTRDPPARLAELVVGGEARGGLNQWAGDVAFTPDGRRVVGLLIDGIAIWDAATGENRETLQRAGNLADQLAISPDGRWLAVTQSVRAGVRILDIDPARP